MAEPWLSAEEIAAHLGATNDTAYDWIADKAMPAHRVGRLWKFPAGEIDEWVRSGGAAQSSKDDAEWMSDRVKRVEIVTGVGNCRAEC